MSRALHTGNPLHADGWDAHMGPRHDPDYRWQPTPVGVDSARLMFGRGFTAGAHAAGPDPGAQQQSAHHRMAGMRMAFAASGGLRSVGELAQGPEPRNRARFAQIARWIATRRIIGFMWEAEPWVPMFQFDAGPQLQPRRDLQPLFDLLIPLYEPWAMANWFARANPWLSGHRPVDDCAGHLSAVMDVAHLEHFIATGQTQRKVAAANGDFCN